MERMQAHAECFGTEIVYNHINEVNLNIRSAVLNKFTELGRPHT